MQTQTQKKGRGRPKGSNSFVSVSLADLNSMFNGADQIQVGRLWLQNQTPKNNKINAEQSAPVVRQETEQAIVEMKLED